MSRVCLVITYIFDCSGEYKEKKGMMMVVFWSKATRVSGHQLHVCTSQKPFSLRGIHKLKLRWFVIFWTLFCPMTLQCNILFTLIILANMAGSAGQFSHPSGMGGYGSYSGWQIFEMAIIRKEWQYSEGMTIRKEWQIFLPNVSPNRFISFARP